MQRELWIAVRATLATLVLTGTDRQSFLNRMLTQELKGLAPFGSRRSFWLNRKGRIDADLRVIATGATDPKRFAPPRWRTAGAVLGPILSLAGLLYLAHAAESTIVGRF